MKNVTQRRIIDTLDKMHASYKKKKNEKKKKGVNQPA
jgi:hypothetical protein